MGARCGKSSKAADDDEAAADGGPELEERVRAPHKSLAVLRDAPTYYVRQELPHDLALCCTGNTFTLADRLGETQLLAAEEPLCSACCGRWWCGPARGFTLRVTTAEEDPAPVLSAERAACRCDWWCCLDCCLCAHRALVRDADGEFVGRVIQQCSCRGPLLRVEDELRETVAEVRGPCCPCRCCCDQLFNVFVPAPPEPDDEDEDAEQKEKPMRLGGRIVKRWEEERVVEEQPEAADTSELDGARAEAEEAEEKKEKPRRYNWDHEHSQVVFPTDAEDVDKALMLGAFFLVNYMYFEMS